MTISQVHNSNIKELDFQKFVPKGIAETVSTKPLMAEKQSIQTAADDFSRTSN